MLLVALVGALLAYVAALPVTGPGSALVADAALRGDFARALWIGIGLALPDGAYAGLAFFGAGAALQGVGVVKVLSHLAASLVLFGVGWKLWSTPLDRPVVRAGGHRAFLLGVSVAAFNPTLLVTWGTVSALVVGGGYAHGEGREAVAFGTGVAVGAVAASITLAALFARLRTHVGEHGMRRVTRAVAVLLGGLGLAALVRAMT
jgi:threonine/homoserine/homoserine lactone efflux protein